MKTNKSKFIVFVFVAFSIISCDSKREYDAISSIADNSWKSENAVSFNFEVKDTINKKDLFLTIRNNQKYSYSNLFLITTLRFPNGKKIVDTLEYEMADNSGHFLGKGFTGIKENKLFYKENVVFPMSGEYAVSVSQAMRKNGAINGIESLKGITEVGFRIEKK
ncbi:Gliding motility lipoprotein GldH [Polaribacter huanghezhanensis]|uniref:gliding motility lipoprotein GldH n=1 Tax=Polaribacter huanghezhanensis TaxID=1354726 RepID=UPI002648160C|nr:gliding motility lipoprotein GldH [Polaribacter huanghezhanensis]WKD85461.1 Gliding motility lipoprotein GldH [Polaribacter huanghezhanensis]